MTAEWQIETIKRYFDDYVIKCKNDKIFDQSKLKVDKFGSSDYCYYEHDGIRINYKSYMAYYLGDHDSFYDVKIVVDDKVILDLEKQ